jgi:hypothetical protein
MILKECGYEKRVTNRVFRREEKLTEMILGKAEAKRKEMLARDKR